MKLQELQDALGKNDSLKIRGGQVFVGPGSLDMTFPAQALSPFYGDSGIEIANASWLAESSSVKVVVKGRSFCPWLSDLTAVRTTEVQATFELASDQTTLAVTVRYKLPDAWKFLDGFPALPLLVDYDSKRFDDADFRPALDTFELKDRYLYWTTCDRELKTDKFPDDVFLEKGLNFAARWNPGGVLGVFEKLGTAGGASEKILHGPIVPSSTDPVRRLNEDEAPWNVRPRIPGIHLRADLGFDVSFPPDIITGSKVMTLNQLRFHIYTPLEWIPESDQPGYGPAMAYAGDLVIPSIGKDKLATMTARGSLSSNDQIVIAGQFEKLNLSNLKEALKDIAGGNDSITVLPGEVEKRVGTLGLKNASITVLNSDKGFEVGATQFTIGMEADAGRWLPFEDFKDLFWIQFEALRIVVVRPFDENRTLYAVMRGAAKFLGIELKVNVAYPGFDLSAEQVGITTVDLGYLKKHGIRLPDSLDFQFQIANIAVAAKPGSYYAFSMSVAPGKEWKIDEYTLPSLRLAVSCSTPVGGPHFSWQFGASTNEGKAVPVSLLIKKLAAEVGITDIGSLPAAVEALTIDSVALAYSGRDKYFSFESRGKFPVNGVTLDYGFTVGYTPGTAPGQSEARFGGELLFAPDGREPLSFSLEFSDRVDSKYCLAAYSDRYGRSLKIRSLAKCIFPKKFADLIPDSLEISIKSAFVAYCQEKQPTTGATEPAPDPALLFGVDLGVKIKLSDLPIVGGALPKDLEIGFESLRVILASAAFSEESVRKFNGLLPPGVMRLPDGSQRSDGTPGKPAGKNALGKGFNVSAALLFGKEPRTLTLPVREEGSGAAAVTGSATTSSLPADQPGPSPVAAAATKWFDIDKSLGPLTIRRIGLDYEAPRVGVKFDASLQVSVLTFNLEGLGLTYALGGSTEPLEILKNLAFTLDGLGLSLGNGPVEIGGSLVRISKNDAPLQLEGTLLIRTVPFTFSALGSYVDLNGTISVMAFAVLLRELGDPTGTGAFVVTGLAFGFGVNRKLTLPPIDDVHKFPLVQAAMGKQDLQNLSLLPAKLRDYVAPSVGNFWVAAGIKFNSFGMVDSFLLLSVSWGAEVEIGLLGLSRMTVPPMVQPEETIASAELSLRGVIRIAEGLIQFEARLTDNSFIFSRNCRLTGGFAFCLWFKGPHAGDFVLSLGGYHPAFVRPAHYPLVPRLGMQLQIGPELSITGEAYFALTPFCVMAGGKLCAVYKSGGIEAWFIAYADFLMNWQPFFYQAAVGITLGIALRWGALAIRLELSVDLKLQGPPFGGEAHVRLWIISFTIPFGTPASAPPPLTGRRFAETCLPAPKLPSKDKSPDVFSVQITGGLLREQEIKGENRIHRIVNAHQLSLVARSVIPCTDFKGLAEGVVAKSECGILPMGEKNLNSVFTVTADGISSNNVKVSAITGKVPAAVWGKTQTQGLVPAPQLPQAEEPNGGTIKATLGICIACIPQTPVHKLLAMKTENFRFIDIEKKVDWGQPEAPPARTIPRGGRTIFSTICSDDDSLNAGRSVVKRRRDILACLRKQLPPDLELNEPNLEKLSKNPDYFQVSELEMASVGSDL